MTVSPTLTWGRFWTSGPTLRTIVLPSAPWRVTVRGLLVDRLDGRPGGDGLAMPDARHIGGLGVGRGCQARMKQPGSSDEDAERGGTGNSTEFVGHFVAPYDEEMPRRAAFAASVPQPAIGDYADLAPCAQR